MRVCFSLVIALATMAAHVHTAAQAPHPAAAVVLVERTVSVNDRPVATNSAPIALPDTALVRAAQGRAMIALKPGGWLFLDADASVRVTDNADDSNRLEVLTGSAIVAATTSAPVVECENEVRLSKSGLFRFDAQPVDARGERHCQVRVYEGAATVRLETLASELRPGQTMMCNRRCGDMIPTKESPPSQLDEFDQWARRTYELLAR